MAPHSPASCLHLISSTSLQVGMKVVLTQAPGSMGVCFSKSIFKQKHFLSFFRTVKSQCIYVKFVESTLLDKELDMLIIGKALGNIKAGCVKIFSWTGGGVCGSVVECFPSKYKVLIINPAKNKNKNVYHYCGLKFLEFYHQRVILGYLSIMSEL